MTPHKHAAVIHAYADGASIEVKDSAGNWVAKKLLSFYPEYEYRVKTAEIGNTFCFLKSNFFLAQVQAFKVCLICLETGNRFVDPVYVCDPCRITEEEFEKITNSKIFKKL